MSDLPGAITKQILSAPPNIILSTRYSLTARGRFQFAGAAVRGVLVQGPLPGRTRDFPKLPVGALQCSDGLCGVAGHKNLRTRRKEFLQAFPPIAQQRRAASRRFKQPA